MKVDDWMDWATGEIAALETKLHLYGYDDGTIYSLSQNCEVFGSTYRRHYGKLEEIIGQMRSNPDDYSHYANFNNTVASLLSFAKKYQQNQEASVPVTPAFLGVTESTLALIDDGLSPQQLAEMVSKTDERLLGVLNGLEVKQLERVLGSDIELATLLARIAADVESNKEVL